MNKPDSPATPPPSSSPKAEAEPHSHTTSVNQRDSATSRSGEAAPTETDPQLPHERDESGHSQARTTEQQKAVGEQAYLDTVSEKTDTDRGPVLDKVYNEQVTAHRGGSPAQSGEKAS